MRKRKTKHSPASSRDSSKSPAAVRAAVLLPTLINKPHIAILPVNTLKSTASGETYLVFFHLVLFFSSLLFWGDFGQLPSLSICLLCNYTYQYDTLLIRII